MTRTASGGIEALRAAMNGPVFGPDDQGYDDVRKVWNADIDRRPAVVARCADAADVVAAIRFAQDEGLEITVRGGAHSYVNAIVEQDEHRIQASYGSKYDRLTRIKGEYDPGNVFHRNVDIKPG